MGDGACVGCGINAADELTRLVREATAIKAHLLDGGE